MRIRLRCSRSGAFLAGRLRSAVLGQGFQGGLRGAIQGHSGGVIPGVEVTLTNERTNIAPEHGDERTRRIRVREYRSRQLHR